MTGHLKPLSLVSLVLSSPWSSMYIGCFGLQQTQMKEIMLLVPQNEVEQLGLLQSHRSTRTLESIILRLSYAIDSMVLSQRLLVLSQTLTHLTYLEIEIEGANDLLIHILQNITMLQTFVYTSVCHKDNIIADETEVVKEYKIKKLHFAMYDVGNLNHINRTLNFALQSCPILEEFNLTGLVFPCHPCVLDLTFLQHPLLKHIYINLPLCGFYTFNEKLEKNWLSHGESITINTPLIWILTRIDD